MRFRLKKVFLLTRKELRESLKSKEIILVITLLPLILAVFLPLTIPLMNLTATNETMDPDDLKNFPPLVPYWDELNIKGKFMVFYTMIYFEMFLLLPMILPLVIAADTIAGERERKTIESLLASPLSTWEILTGKLLTTIIPSVIITWISGIIMMAISDAALYQLLGRLLFPNLLSVILLFGFSPFLSMIVTQTMIIVSTKAAGMREAQQLGSLVVIPLYSLILGETALIIISSPYWTFGAAAILLGGSIFLLFINHRLFDREAMITAIGG
ncbi:MAG: ABC transporter permease subunit [Candidatus Heimdallarchaeota archaeon]|nr:ABC transporter permease subunit [Candidatus Heimdallarchaeota archaeon]